VRWNAALAPVFFTVAVLISGCTGADSGERWVLGKPLAKEHLKIGIIYVTNPLEEDAGYSWAHDAGFRKTMKELLIGEHQIIRKVNIFDDYPEYAESAMRECIMQGANLIIATSWGYMDTCEALAREFPRVIFVHASGYKQNDSNFANFFGRIYQARYLAGLAAGLKTRTGRIGYVAAMDRESSEVTGGLNAFALGVERTNPAARIHVRITWSWFDPMGESMAAQDLLDAGCDVLAQHVDTAAPMLAAERAGVWGIGYSSDMGVNAPRAVLTNVIWHWEVYYTHLVQSIIDGSFTTAPYFDGIAGGLVDISPLTEYAAAGTAELVAAERKRLEDGTFNVFDGVLETADGETRGEAGRTLPDAVIKYGIDWYYRNIVGE
jgi:basic membrane protein A